MKQKDLMSRRVLIVRMGTVLGVGLSDPKAWALPKYSDCSFLMDMEVPLAIGTVRTPPFPVKSRDFYILLRLKDLTLPREDMTCLLGTNSSFPFRSNCNKESVIEGS